MSGLRICLPSKDDNHHHHAIFFLRLPVLLFPGGWFVRIIGLEFKIEVLGVGITFQEVGYEKREVSRLGFGRPCDTSQRMNTARVC